MRTVVVALGIFVLGLYRVHPRSGMLAFACEEVTVEQGEETAVIVIYLPHLDIGVEHRYVMGT